jgi:hypothetical protein
VLVVRWCLRYGLSYRDVEELLAEQGIEVDPPNRVHVPRGPGKMRTATGGKSVG